MVAAGMELREHSCAVVVGASTVEVLMVMFANRPLLFISDMGKIASIVSVERLAPNDPLMRPIPTSRSPLSSSDAFSIHSTVLLGPDEVPVLTTVKKVAGCFFTHNPRTSQLLVSCSVKKLNAEFVKSFIPQLDTWLKEVQSK